MILYGKKYTQKLTLHFLWDKIDECDGKIALFVCPDSPVLGDALWPLRPARI